MTEDILGKFHDVDATYETARHISDQILQTVLKAM